MDLKLKISTIETIISRLRQHDHHNELVELIQSISQPIETWATDSVLDNYSISLYYVGEYERSFEISTLLLRHPLPNNLRSRAEKNRIFTMNKIKPRLYKYPKEIIKRISPNPNANVTFTVTTCKRLVEFCRTMNSFLQCCLDQHKIKRWICIDDNSSELDREIMQERYPFFEFIFKTPEQKGHAESMNMLLETIDTPYMLHIEDDWLFVEKREYIADAIRILDSESQAGQVVFNRNCMETEVKLDLIGGIRKVKDNMSYLIHEYYPKDSKAYQEFWQKHSGKTGIVHWPHFTLNPSFIRVAMLKDIGKFDLGAGFEFKYGLRCVQKGYYMCFFDSLCCVHIGRLLCEAHTDKKNAYELNRIQQF